MPDRPSMSVLVTGSNGLVGASLCTLLEQAGNSVTRVVRRSSLSQELCIGDIDGQTDWSGPLTVRPDSVVHLAARLHVMQNEDDASTELFRRINTEGTINLARQCAARGVKRFVFLSTVKVLGEGREEPYLAHDPAAPQGAYAISKWEAEQGLWVVAEQTGMEVVILRPPLVYGPGVRANFLGLLRAIDRGLPLPLGAIHNKRSLIYLGNLVDAISECIVNPAAAGQVYMVSDGEDVSTTELIRAVADALGRPARLVPVPGGLLRLAASLFAKQGVVDRLLGSLTVDSLPIREQLGWSTPYTMRAGLAATAGWFREVKSDHAAGY